MILNSLFNAIIKKEDKEMEIVMIKERVIISFMEDNVIVMDVIEEQEHSLDVLKKIEDKQVVLKKRIVSDEYYQELVDEGGYLIYF